jgi:hypothetical protein
MKYLALTCLGLLFVTGCTTKVYNQPATSGPPMVIEHDRTVPDQPQDKPEVRNDIHVDHQ